MRLQAVRAVLSSVLLIAFLLLVLSGAMLYFGKTGLILGFSRSAIRDCHLLAALLMTCIAPIHVWFNRHMYKHELGSLAQKHKE